MHDPFRPMTRIGQRPTVTQVTLKDLHAGLGLEVEVLLGQIEKADVVPTLCQDEGDFAP